MLSREMLHDDGGIILGLGRPAERTFARRHFSELVVGLCSPMLLSVVLASQSSEPFGKLQFTHCNSVATTGATDLRGELATRLRLPVGTNRAGLILRLSAQGIERLSQPAE
jgi:hypothetical protein